MEFSEKQLQIIRATEKLFAEKGYEGTSVRDIAQVAGVNVAMISYYFGSKEKLLGAIFNHRISLSRLQLETSLLDQQLTSAQKIEALIDNYVEKILKNPHYHRITLPLDKAKEMKDIAKLIHETKLQNLELVKKIVSEGKRRREFAKGIDVSMLMVTMLGTATHMINNIEFYRIMYGLEEQTEEEVHHHLKKKLTTHLKQVFKSLVKYEAE
jgi:AcrR family transcriptional regulator